MAKIGWGKILAGIAAAAAAGATYAYLRERAGRSPRHETLLSEGAYEMRHYPALLLVETVQHGSRDRALGNGFGLLADYMFGENREGDEIPMILPVLALPVAGGSWRIRFLIPDGFTRETLPKPAQGLAITELPARDMAVLKFGGKPTDALLAAKEADLRVWIEAKGRVAAAVAEHGYYNSPLRPGPVRQNEVLVELA
ncbi:MAG: heme-binding protein [Rhizorhabdus sp.]|nr:heme-binding protein [Rhizorhabdus sp.]